MALRNVPNSFTLIDHVRLSDFSRQRMFQASDEVDTNFGANAPRQCEYVVECLHGPKLPVSCWAGVNRPFSVVMF